jgi:hypothetical protein
MYYSLIYMRVWGMDIEFWLENPNGTENFEILDTEGNNSI